MMYGSALNECRDMSSRASDQVFFNIASIECGALPKPSTLSGMLAEMKCLVYQQISDELIHESAGECYPTQ